MAELLGMNLADELRFFWNEHWRATVAGVTGAALGVMGTLVAIELTPVSATTATVASVAAPVPATVTAAPAPAQAQATSGSATESIDPVSLDCLRVMPLVSSALNAINPGDIGFRDSETSGHKMGAWIVEAQEVAKTTTSPELRDTSTRLANSMLSIRGELLSGTYGLDVDYSGLSIAGDELTKICLPVHDPLSDT